MPSFKDVLQTADWKTEKHVPVIDAPDKVKKGDNVSVGVSVGKEIPHPNTTEHHIAWVEVSFLPKGEKFAYPLGRVEFLTHGGSAQGPNTSTVYTQSTATICFKTEKPGTLFAVANCNIHGFWENSKEIVIE